MVILELAEEIYRELGKPSDLSSSSVGFWLKGHIGDLNNLIIAEYSLDTTQSEITPTLTEEEKCIFKKLYMIYFYDMKIRENLAAAAQNIVLEISSDGSTVRTVNKNELSKTYVGMRKMTSEELNSMVESYKRRGLAPLQVVGDDTITPSVATNPYSR